jgi:hypothetical protein
VLGGATGSNIYLIVPAAANVPITVSWRQAADPSDPESDATDRSTSCAASRVVTLPILAANPGHVVRLPGKPWTAFLAAVPALKRPDLSPLTISVKTSARAKYPATGAKAHTMVVPMLTASQVKYTKPLPSVLSLSRAGVCRVYWLTCGAVSSTVSALDLDSDALSRGVEKPDLDGAVELLARTQPARAAVRYGAAIDVFPGGADDRPFGFDVEVRQSGRVLARIRRAGHCRDTHGHLDCGVSRQSTKVAKPAAAARAARTRAPVPGLPDLDDLMGQVARFELSVSGVQQGSINFTWDPSPTGACHILATGSLTESWHYERGKGVVMEFRKVGGRYVVVQRAGRSLGDAAFAAPGTVQRDATGQFQAPTATGCPSYALRTADCGTAFKVQSDLALGWSKGKLTLQQSGPAGQKKNPAEGCGMLTDVFNFDQLVHAYPFVNKQRADLSAKRIFGNKRNLKLTLNDKFLAPADEPAGYTTFTARGAGRTTLTLKRLGDD